jgi:hypothetical protein
LFDGVTTVENLGGFPISIKVGWNATPLAAGYRVYAVTKNSDSQLFDWNLVTEIKDPSVSSYIHRDVNVLLPGLIYTYKVRALDIFNAEDPNENQKSTVGFEGLAE